MRMGICLTSLTKVWLLPLTFFGGVAITRVATSDDVFSCSELLNLVELGREGMIDASIADMERTIASLDLDIAIRCVHTVNNHFSGRDGMVMVLARTYEAVANHPACIDELITKSPFETRCAQKYYKIAIQMLLGSSESGEASETFKRAVSLLKTSHPSSRIPWPSVKTTPTIWIQGLRSAPTWDCSLWPFTQALEASTRDIRDEILALSGQRSFAEAYPYLSQNGSWQNLFLYQGRQWNAELCDLMPTTCRLLAAELPTKPGVPFTTQNNEEVVIFRSKKGASVGQHCGATNNQINLHITLTGDSTASLRVGDEEFLLRDGRTICFQDSYAHAVDHFGEAERISLVVRVMHPEMDTRLYGNATRTDAVVLGERDAVSSLSEEVVRLREEYRQLARSSITSRKNCGTGERTCSK